jgi:predicted ester cyclase
MAEHKDVYRRYLAALVVKDPDAMDLALDQVLDEGFVAHDLPGGLRDGRGALKAFRRQVHIGFPNQTLTIEDLIEDGDRVAARLTAVGSHLGQFRGVPPTGQTVTMEIFDIVRVTHGRITERWTMFDRGGLLLQLQEAHRHPGPSE